MIIVIFKVNHQNRAHMFSMEYENQYWFIELLLTFSVSDIPLKILILSIGREFLMTRNWNILIFKGFRYIYICVCVCVCVCLRACGVRACISWRGEGFERGVRPYCNLRLLIPLFVCTYVVIFCNRNMLKQKIVFDSAMEFWNVYLLISSKSLFNQKLILINYLNAICTYLNMLINSDPWWFKLQNIYLLMVTSLYYMM